ncbi:MAG: hypothetical protein RLZZ112_360 [Verrucomicrobiota bacterium]
MSFLSSPQPPQLPARRVETEAMETTSPNKARHVILFILKEYRTFAGMQMDQPRLSAEGPVEEIDPDQEENQSQDPASVFGGNSFANLAGSDRGFGVEGSQSQRQ